MLALGSWTLIPFSYNKEQADGHPFLVDLLQGSMNFLVVFWYCNGAPEVNEDIYDPDF